MINITFILLIIIYLISNHRLSASFKFCNKSEPLNKRMIGFLDTVCVNLQNQGKIDFCPI